MLLNLSRDQLDRVGEINMIERKLRACVAAHPEAVVIANCDDVLVTSVAYDAKNVVWVAAGGGWASDAASCPRTGEPIVLGGLALAQHRVPTSRARPPTGGWTTKTSTGPTV